jgi:hypothetical protein
LYNGKDLSSEVELREVDLPSHLEASAFVRNFVAGLTSYPTRLSGLKSGLFSSWIVRAQNKAEALLPGCAKLRIANRINESAVIHYSAIQYVSFHKDERDRSSG